MSATEPDEPAPPSSGEGDEDAGEDAAAAAPLPEIPEPLGYRIKRRLLGPPLAVAQQEEERLGKPTALAVFASDNLSSAAYASEEILRVLVPAAGVAAFALVVPITAAMLVVLAFLILSYRQTIKAYPTAGGAYMVTRDNFGMLPAQVAGVALLTDYVLTVAVSVAAGTDAVTSAFSALKPLSLLIAVAFVALVALGNLRGVRQAGTVFSVPTYFFIAIMALLLATGLARGLGGGLHPQDITHLKGTVKLGKGSAGGLLRGAGLFAVLHAFASGGAAVTGVEAISNGVSAFKQPQWRNARNTLVVMGIILATMFFGLSALSTKVHAVPYEKGTPTVISQIGDAVFGGGPLGRILFYALQGGTALILIMAANTSFADFPRLANFHATDDFMPRQLTKKGHRLVFSSGILALAGAAILALLATGASVDRLIPLYALGVFTSFTLSQGGMARHHWSRREEGWRAGLVINGVGAALSFGVTAVILVTKFSHGAWVILVLVPLLVAGLIRLNKEYDTEREQLTGHLPEAIDAEPPSRHVVVVAVEKVDAATAAALRYARMLKADEVKAVHFVVDPEEAERLAAGWEDRGLGDLALELVECRDRQVGRAAAQLCAELAAAEDTEVSILVPRPVYNWPWRLMHNHAADAVARATSGLSHVTMTFVPYAVGTKRPAVTFREASDGHGEGEQPDGVTPIGAARTHDRVTVRGRVHTAEWKPEEDGHTTLVVTLTDDTGTLLAVWPGRARRGEDEFIPGAELELTGVVERQDGRLTLFSPQLRERQAAAPEDKADDEDDDAEGEGDAAGPGHG